MLGHHRPYRSLYLDGAVMLADAHTIRRWPSLSRGGAETDAGVGGTQLRERYDVRSMLQVGGVTPSSSGYALSDVLATLESALGVKPWVECNHDKGGAQQLFQVGLCLDKHTLQPLPCEKLSNVRVARHNSLAQCARALPRAPTDGCPPTPLRQPHGAATELRGGQAPHVPPPARRRCRRRRARVGAACRSGANTVAASST
jgi:hypothetical protein